MVDPHPSTFRMRIKALPAFLGFIALGALSLWLALTALIPSVRAMSNHASSVVLSPHDTIGLPLALLFLALAGMTLSPAPEVGPGTHRRRHGKSQKTPGLNICLAVAMASVLLTVIIIPVTEITANVMMANRHYLSCPTPLGTRHPPMRWILPTAHCP